MIDEIRAVIKAHRDPDKGVFLQRFFKTGEGQYGYGDVFYGLTVPTSRKIVKQFTNLPLDDVKRLLQSKVHEERLIALLILVAKFTKSDEKEAKDIYSLYLENTKWINNWDLVDSSADKIVGEYLKTRDRSVLLKLAKSDLLWDRRISMIATFQFIKDLKEYEDTFAVADILMQDKHDLIQKAVGWMLREVGKRAAGGEPRQGRVSPILIDYLDTRYRSMPRTALRYAIEHFTPEIRKQYLLGHI